MQHYITVAILGMKKNAMPKAEPAVEYVGSYNHGYSHGISGCKSLVHGKRLISKREYDKGYAKGWKEYTHRTLTNILKGEV